MRKAYIEEKGKCSRMGDDTNVANTNARPSVTYVKASVWLRNPQRKPSSFQHEVSFVDIVTFLKGKVLTLIKNLGMI